MKAFPTGPSTHTHILKGALCHIKRELGAIIRDILDVIRTGHKIKRKHQDAVSGKILVGTELGLCVCVICEHSTMFYILQVSPEGIRGPPVQYLI